MIVNVKSDCVEIITHYAHGLQSGQIAYGLKRELRPKHWVEMLTAIIEHDDEQINFEKNNNLTDYGFPSDFTLVQTKESDILERCKRIITQCRHRSGWVFLMVMNHLQFIYSSLIEENKEIKDYFHSFESKIKKIRRLYSITKDESDQYYEILRFCDRLSLILSMEEVPSDGRKLEINKSINNKTYYISKLEENYKIEPWPFEIDFNITSEVYQLKKIIFKSNDELQNHLLQEIPILKTWNLVQ